MNNITLRGDWRKLNPIAKKLGDTSDYFKNELMSELAEEVRTALHEVVNSLPPPSNASSTVERKGFNAPLYETGGMEDDESVVATPYIEGRKVSYIIQGNSEILHSRTGTSYEDILGINEEGGGNVPGRFAIEIAYDRKSEDIKRLCINRLREYWRD